MQSFTKEEIKWAARELAESAERMKRDGETATARIERGLYKLRAEQFGSISERLAAALANGDKRIAIR